MGLMKPWHVAVLVIVVLLLFGAKRLPDLAKSVGQSLKIFKKEIKELQEDDTPVAPVAPAAVVTPVTPVVHPVDTSKPATPIPESTTPPKA